MTEKEFEDSGRIIGNTRSTDINVAQSFSIDANPRRVYIHFSFSGAAFCQINVDNLDANNRIGWLDTGYTAFKLHRKEVGILVTRKFLLVNASAGLQFVSFTEGVLQ